MLKEFRESEASRHVTLFYRSFPLDGAHPWARTAGLIATCVQAQRDGESYFIDLADFFFSEQSKLTMTTLKDATLAHLRTLGGFNEQEFVGCMASGAAERQMAADLDSARIAEVEAVPTIFVNGHKIQGVPTSEQFRTVIKQSIAASKK